MVTCGYCGHPGTHATVVDPPGAPATCTGCERCDLKRANDAAIEQGRAELRAREAAQQPFMDDFRRASAAEHERLRRMRDGDDS